MQRPYQLLFALLLAVAPLGVFAQTTQATQLDGRILLQVESKGEAWYVSPVDHRRYALGRPVDTQRVMSGLGLGISNADLERIPVEGALLQRGDDSLRARLAGRILLQVESKGEAWYVDPLSRSRRALGRATEAFQLLQTKGLGISDADLSTIPEGRPGMTSAHYDVPFTAQAPLGEWSDKRQQEGCEEASVLMAMKWATGGTLSDMEARTAIIAMSDWEQQTFGYYQDTSVQDTADRLFRQYFQYTNIEVKRGIDTYDILAALNDGTIVVTAINGRTINNPFFADPAPLRHMIVVVGYDLQTDEFIVHEPGTKNGADFRYSQSAMERSLRDYASGRHAKVPTGAGAAMIIVHKK